MERFMELLFQPLKEFWESSVSFIPNLLATVVIIAGGVFLAWLARLVMTRVLRTVNFDRFCDSSGLTAVVRKAHLWSKPSEMTTRFIFWFLVIVFSMVGLSALRLATVDNLIAQFFLYLPRAFSAAVILSIGYVIAGFISRAVLIGAVNSGYHYAKILAEAVRLLLIVLILAMALEQLQIAPGIVLAAFSITCGGIVLALSIAFGVGGIDTAKRMIERRGEEDEQKEKGRDIEHL